MSKIRRVARHHPFLVFVVSAAAVIVAVLGIAAVARSSVLGNTGATYSSAPTTTEPITTSPRSTPIGDSPTTSAASTAAATTPPVSAAADALDRVLDVRDVDQNAAVLDLTGRCLANYPSESQDALYSTCNDLAVRHLATGRRAGCNSWPTLRMLFDKFMSVVSDKPGDRSALQLAISVRDLAYITCASGA